MRTYILRTQSGAAVFATEHKVKFHEVLSNLDDDEKENSYYVEIIETKSDGWTVEGWLKKEGELVVEYEDPIWDKATSKGKSNGQ